MGLYLMASYPQVLSRLRSMLAYTRNEEATVMAALLMQPL